MPYLTPDDQDPTRTPGHAGPSQEALPTLDALDVPPQGYDGLDPRPVVEGEEALGLITATVCLTILALAVLNVIVPSWCRGVLLLIAPMTVAIVSARHRLCANAHFALGALGIGYITVVLLCVG